MNDIIRRMVVNGLLSAAIGEVLSKDEEEDAFIGALLGAAIVATAKASEDATKTKLPQLVVKNGSLYEVNASGEIRFIKEIKKCSIQLPERFTLS